MPVLPLVVLFYRYGSFDYYCKMNIFLIQIRVVNIGEINSCFLQVKAGMQRVLQVFITNSANVFLLEQAQSPELVEGQVSGEEGV